MRRHLATFIFTGALALAGAGALAQAEADRQLDAALERLRAAFGPEARLSVGLRQVDPVTGRARLGDLTITAPRERISITELLVQEVTETRLGRAEARSVLLVTNIGAEEDRFELARLVLGGVTLPPPGTAFDPANFALGSMEMEALRGTGRPGTLQVGRATAEGYGPGVLGAATIEGVDFRDTGKNGVSFRLGRVAVQALVLPPLDGSMPDPRQFSVQNLTLEGAALRDPDKAVELDIGRFALRDWVPGRLTDLALEGARVAAPFGVLGAGDVRIGRIATQGIDWANTLAAALDEVQMPDPVVGTPQTLVVEGVTAEAEGRPVFTLGRISADGSLDATGLFTTGMDVHGLRITLPPTASGWLERVGYREIAGGLELRGTARRENGVLEIAPFGITWDQAFNLATRIAMTGMPLPRPGERTDEETFLPQLLQGRLHGLTLTLRDQGLLGRVIAWQAREQGVPEAQLREQYAQMAMGMPIPGAAPPGRPAPQAAPRKGAPAATPPAAQADPFRPVREAVAQFIRQSGELEISLRPAQPIAFGEMQELASLGPVEAARRLGLSAAAR